MQNVFSAEDHRLYQVRVHECNVAKGWFDKPVSFIEAMGLLMTEVIEAYEAYVDDGLLAEGQAKPQMASEFADCYIRLVDDCERFGSLHLGLISEAYAGSYESSLSGHFPEAVFLRLVGRIRNAIEAYRSNGMRGETAQALAHFWFQLMSTCDLFRVDLHKEVAAKIAVNWGRPYRHGNKLA